MIKLESVYKNYFIGKQKVPVLKWVSLHIEEWAFVSIMWPSGSGKSTLMNIIGMLDNPSSGEYVLDWKRVDSLSENEQSVIRGQKIWFVFQSYNLISRMIALKQVMLPLSYQWVHKTISEERAKAALIRVWLEDKILNKPNELSWWQQQRIAIARAIVINPSIILADEPTWALDTKTGQDIMKLLTELNNEWKSIIIITHEPDIAKYTKEVIHIRDGQIE